MFPRVQILVFVIRKPLVNIRLQIPTRDIFGASKTDEEVRKRKDEMGKEWEIKDVGGNDFFLGMRVQQNLDDGTIRLTQRPHRDTTVCRTIRF